MRFLVMALVLAATVFTWSPSSDAVQAVEHGFTLGATGTAVECDGAGCVVYGTGTFQLVVSATNVPVVSATVPLGGYSAFGASITLRLHCPDSPAPCVREMTYLPRASCLDEVVWPDVGACHYTTHSPPQPSIFASTGEGWPMPQSFFTGELMELDVQCPEVGVHRVSFSAQYYQAAPFQDGGTSFGSSGPADTGVLDLDCRAALEDPQPTPPASAVVLDFDTYPGGDWQLASNGGSSYVSGGILTINAPADYHEFILRHPDGLWHQQVSNSRGWVIESRLRVAPSSEEQCGDDLKIWAHDHTNLVQIGFGTSEVCLIYPDIVRYSMDTTDGFHVYRIESRLNNVKVYVDGDLVIDHILSRTGGGSDILMFGDGNGAKDTKSLSYWDYFWYDVTPDDPPPTPVRGDGNCDGTVDALDALRILQYVAGLVSPPACPENADANADGDINSLDALFVLQLVAGMLGGAGAG